MIRSSVKWNSIAGELAGWQRGPLQELRPERAEVGPGPRGRDEVVREGLAGTEQFGRVRSIGCINQLMHRSVRKQ